MTNSCDLTNLLFNENAYFYKKKKDTFLFKSNIEAIFKKASSKRTGNYLLRETNKEFKVENSLVRCSACVFKCEKYPVFIKEPIDGWVEIKLSYLLIADFGEYAFIIRRNITNVDSLLNNYLDEIDYEKLSTLFVDENTKYERLSMNNTSITSESIRGRSVEGLDLENSLATMGLGGYVPTSTRINNSNNKTTISFSTARIANYGGKKGIYGLLVWGYDVIERVKRDGEATSFLNIFATPVAWDKLKDKLVPSSILFNLVKLHADISSGKIKSIFSLNEDESKTKIGFDELLSSLESCFDVSSRVVDENDQYYVEGILDGEIILALNPKSITLQWGSGPEIYLEYEEGEPEKLTRYLSRYNYYIIYFESKEHMYMYTMRRLYRNSSLLGYTEGFLRVFHGCDELGKMKTEKGEDRLHADSEKFPDDCLFGYIENTIMNDATYGILDDLGDEWADYILLDENKIQFVHAKHGTSSASASAFHDIVSQALKNIGNLDASEDRLNKKRDGIWSRTYKLNKLKTNIRRLRKGDDIGKVASYFVDQTKSPILSREVVLVVNFISKDFLQNRIDLLKKGERFAEDKQIIQILWLISGLINTCMEGGMEIKIYCKK